MRLSLILPNLAGGGAERVSLDLAHEFTRLGYEVEFWLMTAEGDLIEEAASQYQVVDLHAERARWVLPTLIRQMRLRQPQAIIAGMWPLTALVPLAAKIANFRGKVLVCEHGMITRQYREQGLLHRALLELSTMIAYRIADVSAGVSVGVAACMATLAHLPANRISVLPNPVPKRPYPSAHSLQTADAMWKSNGPRILSVGSFKPVKNYPLLLRSFAKLGVPDACLLLLGKGDGEAALRALAQELGVAERVTFAGFHKNTAPFYATADLFVLSSNSEGLPTVIIEALSFGLPIVSTDCPSGPSEILEGGKLGRLVPVGNKDALTDAMREALASAVDENRLKRRADDFSPEAAAQKYLHVLGLD